jgi:hypothetical protein
MQEKQQLKNPEPRIGTVSYIGISCKRSPWSHRKSACVSLTVIRRTHRVLESLHLTEFPFKSLCVFDHKRSYLVNRRWWNNEIIWFF